VRPSREPAGRAARDHDETFGEAEVGQLAGDGFLDGGVDGFALLVGELKRTQVDDEFVVILAHERMICAYSGSRFRLTGV